MEVIDLKTVPFLEIPTLQPDIEMKTGQHGVIYLKSRVALKPRQYQVTKYLQHWAAVTPHQVFLGQKNKQGNWKTLTFREVWESVQSISQYLLNSPVSIDRPVAILSGNSIEHGLLALAAMHVGIPYSPISPAYSTQTRTSDFARLRFCVDLLSPGLLFVQNGKEFEKPLSVLAREIPVMAVEEPLPGQAYFREAVNCETSGDVEAASQKVNADTVAKILFTSGSTDKPKGVINTQGNLTTNWQQITQTFPFMENGGLTLMDWLPWNHTFGGNHNFGLTLFNGGSIYIDEGNPTPAGMVTTVKNLRDVAPTVYFNVPRGFEELIPYLKADRELSRHFFSQLKMFFYAGASMPQRVWDGLDNLAYGTTGKRLLIATGLGMTEASPSAMFNTEYDSLAGRLGVPVPGLEVKLVPDGDKLEARFKGENITPGYWCNPEATENAFDKQGFYKTGDAVKFVDPADPNRGMIFDGRIAEDFKLDTGTWVSVGVLKARLIAASDGLIRDAVITGHDRSFLGAIIFPELNNCSKLAELAEGAGYPDIASHPKIRRTMQKILNELGRQSTGSSTHIRRALLANFELSIEKGEITDKGSINQKAVLKNRNEYVEMLYRNALAETVFEFQEFD